MTVTGSVARDRAIGVMALLRAAGVPADLGDAHGQVRIMTSYVGVPGQQVVVWGLDDDQRWCGTAIDEERGGEVTRTFLLSVTIDSPIEESATAILHCLYWGQAPGAIHP